jgi:hypothetical protein
MDTTATTGSTASWRLGWISATQAIEPMPADRIAASMIGVRSRRARVHG